MKDSPSNGETVKLGRAACLATAALSGATLERMLAATTAVWAVTRPDALHSTERASPSDGPNVCKLLASTTVATLATERAGTSTGALMRKIVRASHEVLEARGLSLSSLTMREHEVLRLVAAGCPTREVARRLSYSERTAKNVLYDVATKFNAHSRPQVVAAAVRDGLI